jgi:hypothetical protein
MLKKWLITSACILHRIFYVVLKNEPIRKEVAHEHEHGALYVHVDAHHKDWPKAESYRGANTNTQSTFFDDTLEFSNLIVTADEHADFEFYVKWVMGP